MNQIMAEEVETEEVVDHPGTGAILPEPILPLALLTSLEVRMEAPCEWGDEINGEGRVQSDKMEDVKAILKALEEGELKLNAVGV